MRGGIFGSDTRLNDMEALDTHLRADIGLAIDDTIAVPPAHETSGAPRGVRIALSALRRTGAKAFAMPLAVAGLPLA